MAELLISEAKAMLADIRRSLAIIEERLIIAPIAELRDAELKLRRMRDSVFPIGYFGDAAWDILLELDRAFRNNRSYAVTDAGIDAKIPLTTALRYLAKLERDGLVERRPDPYDRRRAFIALTAQGQDCMDRIFAETAGT
jgi:DNA-binding MarR family transcriptional regulator